MIKSKSFFSKQIQIKYWLILSVIVGLVLFAFLCRNEYLKGIVVKILIYMILATGLNATNGYSGQMNIGYAGFVCVGAYTTALLMTKPGFGYWESMLCSAILASLVGIVVSIPTLKLTGIFLAIVSLGFSEIIRLIVLNWSELTGGPVGVKGIPRPMIFGNRIRTAEHFIYLALAILLICLFLTNRVLKSRIGRAWLSIREDEDAAKSLGINTRFYRCFSFSYGAFWAGVGGSLIPVYYMFINSDMFASEESFNILSMVIIGGQGTLLGPLLGSVLINMLTEVFRFAVEYRYVVYAILILIVMYIRPQGLLGDSGIVKKTIKPKTRISLSKNSN